MNTRRWPMLCAPLTLALFAAPIIAAGGTTLGPARPRTAAGPPSRIHRNDQTRRPQFTQYCTGKGPFAFVGGGENNVAGAQDSGILAGAINQACGQFDAVSGGSYNAIFPNGGSDYASFIGAGENNAVYSNGYGGTYGSFIGAGNSNSVTAWFAAVGSGHANLIDTSGADSFIGAGDTNYMNGEFGFIGAGTLNSAEGTGAFVGAGSNNVAAGYAAVVAGSTNTATGVYGFVGSGSANSAGEYSFVGSGQSNAAGLYIFAHANVTDAFVGAGTHNAALGNDSFIGAGSANDVTGQNAFIGAGMNNVASGSGAYVGSGGMSFAATGVSTPNAATGIDAFVGAGDGNVGGTLAAFVGGGIDNDLTNNRLGGPYGGAYAVIGGGYQNAINPTVTQGGEYGVVGGGFENSLHGIAAVIGGGAHNQAAGAYAVTPGGLSNTANGNASFAAGTKSGALHNGTFVWSDDAGTSALNSTAPYQFLARASGGFYLYSNAADTAGVKLAPGSGTWASLSDRSVKTGIVPLDDADVLEKVARLPVSEWSYISERGVRHVGPMAQDFYAAFGVGEDDRHITTIDEDGVALAAVKALYEKNIALRNDIGKLHNDVAALRNDVATLHVQNASLQRERDQNASLQRELAALETRVAALSR